MELIIDVWQEIMNYCDLPIQIRLNTICKLFHNNLYITELDVDPSTDGKHEYWSKFDASILEQRKFRNLTKLFASDNNTMKFMPTLNKLRTLDASIKCNISKMTMTQLNLIELNIFNNNKMYNISHMTKLKKLNISSYWCGVEQKNIAGLNLIELDASNNDKIFDVSFMKNLKHLKINNLYTFGQKGIYGLDLIYIEY